MPLHICESTGATVDEFWECECAVNYLHRKGTMPKCLHEDPFAPGCGYENSADRLEPWNVTEYCPICDAHEQDCSDALVEEVLELGFKNNLQLTIGELADLIIAKRRLEAYRG